MAQRRRVKQAVRRARPLARTPAPVRVTPGELRSIRDLFWQNVMREVLVSLATLSARRGEHPPPVPGTPDPAHALDGRLGIITNTGLRVPIAAVYPVFSASMPRNAEDKALSAAVECTVFQVHTPTGEVYTLPLEHIRGFHSLSEQLLKQLEANSRGVAPEGEVREPFGFAAFTSLSRSVRPGKSPSDDLSGAL